MKSEMLSNRHTHRHTDTQTHRPSTITLAAHAHRGLTMVNIPTNIAEAYFEKVSTFIKSPPPSTHTHTQDSPPTEAETEGNYDVLAKKPAEEEPKKEEPKKEEVSVTLDLQ